MPRLIVNPGTPQAYEWELRPGVNSLGRSPENDLPLDHESVAGRHCEILVGTEGVTIFDLDPAGGTLVEGNRVAQAELRDGQNLKLGLVALQFRTEPVAAGASVGEAAPLQVSTPCHYHPKSPARHLCKKCGKAYCPLCIGRQRMAGEKVVCCRKCGSVCVELALGVGAGADGPLPFRELAAQAFKYPLQGDGWVLLVAGTLFYALLDFLQNASGFAGPYGGVAGLVVGIFGMGYLVAYLQKIVAASAMGEDRLPDWPDYGNWQEDIVAPLLKTLGLLAFCLWPIVLALALDNRDQPAVQACFITAGVLGLIYLPMAMLAVYMADAITASNPLIVIPAIFRLRGQYWIVCALLAAVALGGWLLQVGVDSWLPVPILPALVSGFVGFFLLTVAMRILGLMYWCNRQRLGWFKA